MMRRKMLMNTVLVVSLACGTLSAQAQVVALRSGKMFDPKSGTI